MGGRYHTRSYPRFTYRGTCATTKLYTIYMFYMAKNPRLTISV